MIQEYIEFPAQEYIEAQGEPIHDDSQFPIDNS